MATEKILESCIEISLAFLEESKDLKYVFIGLKKTLISHSSLVQTNAEITIVENPINISLGLPLRTSENTVCDSSKRQNKATYKLPPVCRQTRFLCISYRTAEKHGQETSWTITSYSITFSCGVNGAQSLCVSYLLLYWIYNQRNWKVQQIKLK